MPRQELTDEQQALVDHAAELGINTFGYAVPNGRFDKLAKLIAQAEAELDNIGRGEDTSYLSEGYKFQVGDMVTDQAFPGSEGHEVIDRRIDSVSGVREVRVAHPDSEPLWHVENNLRLWKPSDAKDPWATGGTLDDALGLASELTKELEAINKAGLASDKIRLLHNAALGAAMNAQGLLEMAVLEDNDLHPEEN